MIQKIQTACVGLCVSLLLLCGLPLKAQTAASPNVQPKGHTKGQPRRYAAPPHLQIYGLPHSIKSIFKAAFEGNLKNFKHHIKQRLNFNFDVRNTDGQAVLHIAAMQGHLNIVKYALKHKAAQGAVDKWGRTALYYAVRQGHIPVVQYWLSKKFFNQFIKIDEDKLLPHKTNQQNKKQGQIQHTKQNKKQSQSQNKNQSPTQSEYLWWVDHMRRGPLHWAALNGQSSVVQFLLKRKWQIDRKDANGRTAFILAALKGQLEVLQLLAQAGADINATDVGGQSALWQAVQTQKWAVAKWLIENQARTDIQVHKKTLLQLIIGRNSMEGIELLPLAGLDLKGRTDSTPLLPLQWAIQAGASPEILKRLVEYGADLNQANMFGLRPLHYAVRDRQVPSVQTLLALGADVNVQDASDQTALSFAVQRRHAEIVRLLLRHHARPTTLYKEARWSLLHEAAMLGAYDVAALLLQNTNIQVDTHEALTGRTPLGVALTHSHFMLAHLLVEQGADVNIRMFDGRSLYHMAVKSENLEAIEFLYHQGLDLELRNKDGLTPLQLAFDQILYSGQKNIRPIIDFFLRNGACVRGVDAQGLSVLNKAYEVADGGLIRQLLKRGARETQVFYQHHETTLLHWAVTRYDTEMLKLVLQNVGSDAGCEVVDSTMPPGSKAVSPPPVWASLEQMLVLKQDLFTPFLLAIKNNRLDMVDVLLQEARRLWPDKDVLQVLKTLSGPQGRVKIILTGWDVALMWGRVDIVRYFVEQGVSPHQRDLKGQTALHMVVTQRKADLRIALVKYLLSLGVDVNARDHWARRTVLHMAAIRGYKEVAKLLLQAGADVRVPDMMGQTAAEVARRQKEYELARLLEADRSAAR